MDNIILSLILENTMSAAVAAGNRSPSKMYNQNNSSLGSKTAVSVNRCVSEGQPAGSALVHKRPAPNSSERCVDIRIGTLNVETLLCDVALANYVEAVRDLKIELLAVQEVRRAP